MWPRLERLLDVRALSPTLLGQRERSEEQTRVTELYNGNDIITQPSIEAMDAEINPLAE